MADRFKKIEDKHVSFIAQQQLFFVGTAAAAGTVNVSPKGMDTLRVINPNKVVWLNLTGSGNETAAHVVENARMTMMFCSFDKQPLILRLYGKAAVIHPRDEQWHELSVLFPEHMGSRQFFALDIDQVQTSCGFAVPYYHYQGERDTLVTWAEKKGDAGIEAYWKDKNQTSLDGKQTHIIEGI